MSAQRFLVVSDEMEVGGSQRQIVHLLLGLKQRGEEVELLYFRKPSFLLDAVVAADIPVHRIDKRRAIDPLFLLRLLRFLRRRRFALVHGFSITAEIWLRLVLPFVRGMRLVSSIRGLGLIGPAWHWRAKRWVLGGSSAVISNSRAGAELVARRCGISLERVAVIPNGVALPDAPTAEERMAIRQALGIGEVPLLLFVGRLVPEKNLALLVEALAAMPEASRPNCWLAGEGPERAAIEARRDACGLGASLRLLGERDDVDRLMRAADALVLPSAEEGLSNVLLEAMGLGLAVVATRVGGSPELVEHAVSGVLVPPGDAAALAAALSALFADSGRRAALGAAARAEVQQRFSIDAMVEATLGIYRKALTAES